MLHHSTVRRAFWVLSLTTLSSGCERKPTPQVDEVRDQETRPLLEPEVAASKFPKRCHPIVGGQQVSLRAPSSGGKSKEASVMEVGNSVPFAGGFVSGVLRSGANTDALVHFTDGRGKEKLVELGRVHGSVDAPQVLATAGVVLVAVSDNDAGHSRVRLARISGLPAESEVTWGPEVQMRRGETATFSLSAQEVDKKDPSPPLAVLAWDDFDKSRSSSRIRALTFDPNTMKTSAVERFLSPVEDDADTPTLVPRKGGFWAVWLAYGKLKDVGPQGSEGSSDLVSEPSGVLRVQALDSEGAPSGEALTVSPAEGNVLAYDAGPYSRDALAIAYRSASVGRPSDGAPINMRLVRLDGSISSGNGAHSGLGPGAPALFSDVDSGAPWLSARGDESEVLLGRVDAMGNTSDFEVEPGLEGQIPLARVRDEILTMRPDGLDLKLSVVQCTLGAAK